MGSNAVTQLIKDWRNGDQNAESQLFKSVYPMVKAIAARQLSGSGSQTLRPTELVNDVLMQLRADTDVTINDSTHLYALAARMIRFLIVDHARERLAHKRGGEFSLVDLEQAAHLSDDRASARVDWISLNHALEQLSAQEPKHAELVELRYFAGMTIEQTSEVMNISVPTAVRMWRFAKVFLQRQLSTGPANFAT
jgi:RNA polymerase sigma factor (TIGR02999 family)